MKIACTVIDGKPVDCGENLQEQKSAVKALAAKYGPGMRKLYVLYSSQAPAVRKKVALPDGLAPDKAYAEGVAEARKIDAARKKAATAASKEREKAQAEIEKRRAARREKAVPGSHPRDEAEAGDE